MSPAPCTPTRRHVATATLALLLTTGCGSEGPVAPPPGAAPVAELRRIGTADPEIWSGRRSPEPVRILALDGRGRPVPGAEVGFRWVGRTLGLLSQPRALTDSAGVAETYLLDSRPGVGVLEARAGTASLFLAVRVLRAPGEIRFLPGTGEAGLPGFPHPDSIIQVQVLDTEGEPLPGMEVWFVGPGEMAPYVDTTDVDGRAGTVLRRTWVDARDESIYAFILGFPEVLARGRRALTSAARRVLLVSIDGLRADAVERYGAPTLLHLLSSGAGTLQALTVVPSLTVPAHLSLLTGVSPATHGVMHGSFEFTRNLAGLTPVFQAAGETGAGSLAVLSSRGPLEGFAEALECPPALGLDSLVDVAEPRAAPVVDAALPLLESAATRLIFVHLPDPDLAGHRSGWESAEYAGAVLAADSALGRLLEAVDDSTLVVVLSDHGGGGAYGAHQHGSAAEADVRIPILLAGPHVRAGAALDAASILDVAPTILWALGTPVPRGYEGRVLLEAFRGGHPPDRAG